MGLKDKFSSMIYGRRAEEPEDPGETLTNVLGESRGYRPGATSTAMKPVTGREQQNAVPAQEQAQAQQTAAQQPAGQQNAAQQPVAQQTAAQPAVPAQPGPGFGDKVPSNAQPMRSAQAPVQNDGFTSAMPYHAQQQAAAPQQGNTGYQQLFSRSQPVQSVQPGGPRFRSSRAQQYSQQMPVQQDQNASRQVPVQQAQAASRQMPVQQAQTYSQQVPVQQAQAAGQQMPVQQAQAYSRQNPVLQESQAAQSQQAPAQQSRFAGLQRFFHRTRSSEQKQTPLNQAPNAYSRQAAQQAQNAYSQQVPVQQAQNAYSQQVPVQQPQTAYSQQAPVQPQTAYSRQAAQQAQAYSRQVPVQQPQAAYSQQMPPQQVQTGFGRQPQAGFGQQSTQQPMAQTAQPAQPGQPSWGNGRGDKGYHYSTAHRTRAETRPRRAARNQEQQPGANTAAQGQAGNISYMNPDHFVDNGTAYAMVMRLTQPLTTAHCYRLIEFMRNGETILVNLELIRDDAEANRCLDLLYGAAFAMGCNFTRVALQCLYLISPRSVEVLSYASMEGLAQRDAAYRWPGSDRSNPVDPANRQQAEARSPFEQSGSIPTAGAASEMRYY